METESFYGVELSEKDPLAQFEVAETDKDVQDQKLIIKQISLGADAKQGEFNVVQAEVKINEKETLKIPIAVLKVGETRVLKPNLEFPSDSVTFKLTQGTGPVYICGQHLVPGCPYSTDPSGNAITFDRDVRSLNDIPRLKRQSKQIFTKQQYTPRERSEIVEIYIQQNKSIVKTQRAFKILKNVRSAPSKNTIKRLYEKFSTGEALSN